MKKYILTTALTVTSAAAFAQNNGGYNYNYDYNYNPEQYNQGEYFKNEPVYQQEPTSYVAAKPTATQQAGSTDRNWSAHLTVGAMNTPEFMGSKDNETKPLIMPTFTYKLDPWQKVYLSVDEGVGYTYSLTNNLELGGGLSLRGGRDSKDSPLLAGLDDVDSTVAYTGFARYKFNKNYRVGIQLAKGIDSTNDGLTTELFAGYARKLNPKTGLDIQVKTVYGDDTFMEQNFGVASANAIPGRAAYDAEAGFYKASVRGALNYHIDGPHSLTAFTQYTKLLGDAKDSTVVEDDSQVTVGGGYTYKF